MRFNKRRSRDSESKGNAPWMTTFTDMTMLILVFFILLFSISKVDVEKFKAIAESYKNYQLLDFYPSIIQNDNPSTDEKPNNQSKGNQEQSLDDLYQSIQEYLENKNLGDAIVANRTETGVVLVLQEQVLFETGKAEIEGGSNDFLDEVGKLLKNIPNMVKVEGHTDNRSITTYRYPSNWELSTARASSVIRYFVEKHGLDSSRFIAVGYGETRPLVPNDSEKNMQKNRRVEIVIADPKYTEEDLTSESTN